MPEIRVYCYGRVIAVLQNEDGANEEWAIKLAEKHIRTCGEGAMPWANPIKWHVVGDYLLAAANKEWLNHHIEGLVPPEAERHVPDAHTDLLSP